MSLNSKFFTASVLLSITALVFIWATRILLIAGCLKFWFPKPAPRFVISVISASLCTWVLLYRASNVLSH